MECCECALPLRAPQTRLMCGHVGHTACLRETLWRRTGCDVEGEEGDLACAQCARVSHLTLHAHHVTVSAVPGSPTCVYARLHESE